MMQDKSLIGLRFFPLIAIFTLTRCECEEQVNTIPEPQIEVLNEAQESSLEAEPWLIAGFNTDTTEGMIQDLTIRNSGNGLLKMTSACLVQANSKEDAILNAPCIISTSVPFSFEELSLEGLSADESIRLSVSYHPEISGPSQLFLKLESNATDEPVTAIQLVGPSGQLCAENIVEFGDVAIGESKEMPITLTSCGSEPVAVERALFLSNPDEVFSVTMADGTDPSGAGTLEAGETLDLLATFAPQDVRLYRDTLAGQYAVETAVPFAAQYGLLLQGNGVPPPSCRLNVVPQVVQFGAVASTESSEQTLILQSVGECACQVTSIEGPVGDEGFEIVNLPDFINPLILAGTRGCDTDPELPSDVENRFNLQVKYTAPEQQNPIAYSAIVTVNSTDETNPSQEVPLQANGGGSPYCQLDVTPQGGGGIFSAFQSQNRYGVVDFGRVSVHVDKRMPITLTNIGNTTCNITSVEWDYPANTIANEFGFEYEDGTEVPMGSVATISLQPTETQTFIAVFAPTHTVESSGASIFPSFNFGSYSSSLSTGIFSNSISGYCSLNSDKCNGVKFVTNDTVTTETVDDVHEQGEFSIGFSATPVEPSIDVIPGELDFGLVTVGCGSPEQRVTVYNTGSGDLTIREPVIDPVVSPEEFVITATNNASGTWPYTIQPGASMSIMVRFYARHVGSHYGNVVIPTVEGGQDGPSFSIPLQGEGTLETSAEDIFEQLTDPKVDVLWVVDDSGSMSWVQEELADNFDEFFSSSNVNEADYHIAVTTTLTTDGNCIGGFGTQTCPVDEMCGHYTSCSGNDRYLTNLSSNPDNQFRCNVKVSDQVNPSRPSSDSAEGALQAARYFLSAPLIDDPAANGGFLRDDAKLHIIAVSDEEDQSEGPIDLYVDFFRNLKGFRNDSLIAFSAIAAPDGGCSYSGGSASGDARYETVVAEMNGRFQSICAPDWTSMMQNLGLDSLGLQVEFFLSRAADPSTLTVYINDGSGESAVSQTSDGATDGYFYDATSNSVVFNPQSIPPRGSTIRVVYETYCY